MPGSRTSRSDIVQPAAHARGLTSMTSPPRLAYVAGFVLAVCVIVVITLETIGVADTTTTIEATPLTVELVGNQVFSTPRIRAEIAPWRRH